MNNRHARLAQVFATGVFNTLIKREISAEDH